MISLLHTSLLSVPIVTNPHNELINYIEERFETGNAFTIFTPNPEILVLAKNNPQFMSVLSKNQINIPDGVGITLFTGIPTIKGRLLMQDIFPLCEKFQKKILITGGSQDVLDATVTSLKGFYPHLQIDAIKGPLLTQEALPVDQQSVQIQHECEQHIDSFRPDIVFVAYGAPKQELWIHTMQHKYPSVSWMAVGGALDTYSGIKPLPPQILQNLHLEWFYRLFREPQRIGRIGNALIIFPLTVLFDTLQKKV